MTADDDLDECPVCGTPVLSVEIRGPSPAERYAQPCGHRLPADFGDGDEDGDATNEDAGDESDVRSWAARLAEQAGDGGGCLETATVAATERHESRHGVVKGLSCSCVVERLVIHRRSA